jgi:hypothetical protein
VMNSRDTDSVDFTRAIDPEANNQCLIKFVDP